MKKAGMSAFLAVYLRHRERELLHKDTYLQINNEKAGCYKRHLLIGDGVVYNVVFYQHTPMARLSRLVIPGQTHCILQRGNDRQLIFRDDEDYQHFYNWVREAAARFRVAIHSYVFLPSQIVLLATPSDANGLAQMMQWIGRHYVPYFNHRHGRTGTLWEGRFRTAIIDAEACFIPCSSYIELYPMRTGLAMEPQSYAWSSYQHHVGLKANPLLTAHPMYWALGNTPFERELNYRDLVAQGLNSNLLAEIEEAITKGKVLGRETFIQELERDFGRRLRPAKRGRPSKKEQ